jgi:glyoxylase-like metal-dependent hydrolase (beta-lactamase superfamily II)
MTLQGTNTYLVGLGKKKILIDTGEPHNAEYMSNLKQTLKTRLNEAEVEKVICTHWHPDHVGGTSSIYRELDNGQKIEFYKFPRSNGHELFEPPCGFKYVSHGHVFKTDGATLRVLYTPGHTDDHISLLLEEEHAIFTGDCVLGKGTTVFEDLTAYMKSLYTLVALKPNKLYPGHGPVIQNAVQRLEMYISNRNICDKRIMEALKSHTKPLSSNEIVEIAYGDELDRSLFCSAENNVSKHLHNLEKDNKIVKCGNKWKFKYF